MIGKQVSVMMLLMGNRRKKPKLTDQLRQAIETADKSRYVISRETGVDQAVLSRFMHHKGGLSMDGIDRLAEALGLELTSKRPAHGPKEDR